MTNKKNARHALFTSVISLILCCAMLVGTTFAWFTDSVTSANNIIKSGNLDIEMFWADGTEAVPADDSADWKDASTGAIFDYSLWEPGYTEVRHIKISNVGSLALKYQLKIVATGEVSKLADVIDVYYTDPAAQVANRTDLTDANKIGTLTEVLAGIPAGANGSLLADEDVTVTLALKMQESAGNEYQDLAIGTDFSVVLMATQYTYEPDSFGSDYDLLAQGGYVSAPAPRGGYEPYDIMPTANTTGSKIGTMNIHTDSVEDPNKPIEISVVPTELDNSVTVDADEKAMSFDITVTNLKEGNTKPIKVELNVGKGLSGVKIYHKSAPITATYNPNTGYAIFETTSFSPYTVVFDAEYKAPVVDEPTQSNLPKAVVTPYTDTNSIEWGNYGQWSPTEGLEANLKAAYTFKCVDTAEAAANSPYANWYCDFYVSLDRDLGPNQIFLGGNYGSFGWVGFHNGDVTLKANEELPLLGSVTQNPWTYADIASFVNTFICGVGDVENALTGATFTVKLRLTNPEDEAEFYNVETINYTFAKTVSSTEDLKAELEAGAENICVAAGTYTFPADKLSEGNTLTCAAGTVFEGTSSLNIKGATVIGATFDADGNTNDNTGAGTGTINGTFKGCTFTGNHGLRYCYAGETVVFEDCVFDADLRGIHFDGGENKVIFRNCVINGFNAIADTITEAVFEDCTFGNGNTGYNGLNLYCNTRLTNCVFEFNTGKTNFIDMEGTGKTLTITNCTATYDGVAADVAEFVGGSKLDQNTVVIDGVTK